MINLNHLHYQYFQRIEEVKMNTVITVYVYVCVWDYSFVKSIFFFYIKKGVDGVPFFIFNNATAFSGAQDPETFINVFRKLKDKNILYEAK